MRLLLVVAALVCPPVFAQPAVKPAQGYSAQVATDWFALALQLVQQTPGFSPPVAARALAYLGLTLYESVVPGMPAHQSLAGQLNELDSLPWAQPDEPLHWLHRCGTHYSLMMLKCYLRDTNGHGQVLSYAKRTEKVCILDRKSVV